MELFLGSRVFLCNFSETQTISISSMNYIYLVSDSQPGLVIPSYKLKRILIDFNAMLIFYTFGENEFL